MLAVELGKNAYDAGAGKLWIGVSRDEAGRATSILCRHDGPCLTLSALKAWLAGEKLPPVSTNRPLLARHGLGLLALASSCAHLEFHCGRPDRDPFRFALNQREATAVLDGCPAETRAGPGPGARIRLVGLAPDLQEPRLDLALQALPIGADFTVHLDDVEGRAQVRPRAYGGTLLDTGRKAFRWPDGSAQCEYELRLLDRFPRGRPQVPAQGVDLIRDGLLLHKSTLGLPLRTPDLKRLAGWFKVGDWLALDPATQSLAARSGATRAFLAAARRLVNQNLAGIPEAPKFLAPAYLARLSSQLTQRLSKAVQSVPALAPVLDRDPDPVRHRMVLDIPFRSAGDADHARLRSADTAIRIRFAMDLPPAGPPAVWAADAMEIVINARHVSAARMADSPAAFECWAAHVASTVLVSLRPGRGVAQPALNEAMELLGLAYSSSGAPASTRSQRERRLRTKEQARLEAQLRGR